MLAVLRYLFNHLAAQAPTSEAYDSLTKQLNTGLHNMFENLDGMKESLMLASVRRFPDARGGKGPSRPWKPAWEFTLWDEDLNFDDEVQVVSGLLGNSSDDEEDSEEEKYVTKGVLGLEVLKKLLLKALTEEEKRIWSATSWPSFLPDVLQRAIQMAKSKSFLAAQAFWATPFMLPPFSAPKIAA